MNEEELKTNKDCSEYVVHDLNLEPALPFPDNTFDIITNAVSVDYLNKPLEVFQEMHRYAWASMKKIKEKIKQWKKGDCRMFVEGGNTAVYLPHMRWSQVWDQNSMTPCCAHAALVVCAVWCRVLKPGGVAYMSFSNRCFPTKGMCCSRRCLTANPLLPTFTIASSMVEQPSFGRILWLAKTC
jgi:SAM-dependent methyltransferase